MDSDVTQSAFFYNLLDWAEAHKKQLFIGLIAVVVVGVGLAFYFVHQGQVQDDANNALSKLLVRTSPNTPEPTPENFMKVANDFPNTDAGKRALLLAASALFTEGKYDEARGYFQRFLQEHADSPFAGQAALGIAASMEAQGKLEDAINAYRNAADRYQTPNVAPQAKMAMARLYQSQGKLTDARDQLEQIVQNQNYGPPVASEARNQLEQLLMAHPELMPTNAPPQPPPMMRTTPAPTAPPARTAPPASPILQNLTNHPPAAPANQPPPASKPGAPLLLTTNKPATP